MTRDGREYLIPNEDPITSQVVNWTHSDPTVRIDITFDTSCGDDPYKVRALAIATAAGVDRVPPQPPPFCHITGFGDSSIDHIRRFWIDDATRGLTNIRGTVFLARWDAFEAEGVSIPFPPQNNKASAIGPGTVATGADALTLCDSRKVIRVRRAAGPLADARGRPDDSVRRYLSGPSPVAPDRPPAAAAATCELRHRLRARRQPGRSARRPFRRL